jgi:alkanesulfonate monooxygenase SsuD/methylene tetrahydromethanopterin reductase-like flavin-dependent oxidoreductase (luciferase family)
MKFCLSIEIQEGMTYADTLAMTRAGEDAGFDAALLAEHYYPSSGIMDRLSADAWVFLGALARETTTIRLGSLVSPVTFRHPSVLAKMAATLDHITGGRAELGVGAGWLEAEHSAYGFPFPEAKARVDLVEEQLQVINGLFLQEPFTHRGEHYQLENCLFKPKPVQQPRLPILIGGRPTSVRLLRLAAEHADEFVIALATPEQCREVRARVDAACVKAGRDPETFSLAVFAGFCVADTEAEAEARKDELLKNARPHMRNTETWIWGGPERAAEQVKAFEAAGVDRLMFSVENDLQREMVPVVGRGIIPLLG